MSSHLHDNVRDTSFVEDVLAGRADLDDLDDYIDAWHAAPEGSTASRVELHDYLGLGWDDYRLWVERPESLRFVFAARRARMPTPALIAATARAGAAARSSDAETAGSVLQWLLERGRVKETDIT